MQTILITGGTGLIGKQLTKHLLAKKYNVIILTRSLKNLPQKENLSFALWDIKARTIDVAALQNADAIIHLAGAGVMDKSWSEDYKKEILNSRTESSRLLIETLKNNPHKVKTILSASAIGWYGPDKISGHLFTEDEKADPAFLGEVCRIWEQSVEAAKALGIRVCVLRTGIVLSEEGGAYAEFRSPLKFFIAAILGNGKQNISWIHIDDLCREYIFALENEAISGSFNAVAPLPVTNKELVLAIAKEVKGKAFIPMHVPQFVLKTMLGQRSIEILKSAAVSSEKIEKEGFRFLYPTAAEAIKEIEKK